MPSLNVSPSICLPVVPETVLMSGKIDPFGVLPSKQSPRVHALIYHCKPTHPPPFFFFAPCSLVQSFNTLSDTIPKLNLSSGVNTLSLFPTMIHSEYCTNKSWLTTAMANPALFNATLFVSSVHLDGLDGYRESSESLYYKLETIRVLNKALKDPELAVADETIAAVLLLGNIIVDLPLKLQRSALANFSTSTQSIIGEPGEVDTHLNGLQKMVNLRGGIQSFTFDGVFLHMLCT